MLRALKMLVLGATSLVIVAVASVLLFWLGRSQPLPAEVVFGGEEEDYDDDDSGEDVDDE